LEFKQGFIASDFSDYTKVLASFCNTAGGVIVFGVSDRPRTIIGSEDIPDEAKWVDRLRADFDLRQVVHAPLEDEDKNLPSEAAKILAPLIKKSYGLEGFATSNVTKLLKHLGLDGDDVHCVYEKKLNRKYQERHCGS